MRQEITCDLVQQYTQIARSEQPEFLACSNSGGSHEKIVLDGRRQHPTPSFSSRLPPHPLAQGNLRPRTSLYSRHTCGRKPSERGFRLTRCSLLDSIDTHEPRVHCIFIDQHWSELGCQPPPKRCQVRGSHADAVSVSRVRYITVGAHRPPTSERSYPKTARTPQPQRCDRRLYGPHRVGIVPLRAQEKTCGGISGPDEPARRPHADGCTRQGGKAYTQAVGHVTGFSSVLGCQYRGCMTASGKAHSWPRHPLSIGGNPERTTSVGRSPPGSMSLSADKEHEEKITGKR
jgi:hypothetical protein